MGNMNNKENEIFNEYSWVFEVEFKSKRIQEMIKKSYAEDIELSSEAACAWMIVRDACFLLEVLHRFGIDEDQEERVPFFIDSVLSRKRHHPLLTEIVKDMLKMENQLPFWALEKIRPCIDRSNDDVWFESALKNLSPIKVAHEGRKRRYNRGSHILQLLHDYIVDSPVPDPSDLQSAGCGNILGNIKGFICPTTTCKTIQKKWLFALIFLPFFVILFILGIIFVILHYIKNHIFDILYSIMNYLSRREDETEEHVPSIGELRRGGMKFKKMEGGISQIEFKKKNSTLYLPQFKVDNRSEVILRNLIALEICSQDEEKPITRYAILMNDLVDTSQDVSLLRREDIITGKLGADEDIAKLWNSMVTPTEMPRYGSIDKAVKSINDYHKKWLKGLAFLRHRRVLGDFLGLLLEFLWTYGSRPWWFFSALIVLVVLVLTAVQVFCLFRSCSQK
ncbi:putative UPF0481 protein At3g02645 [Cryptomeria japonica]|uniref:putative UPF0481 protein At3g02645 n=1 Tax=Cryptomeria japonica TaxID=3369 RepID=UPI0025AD1492|nr:putative UPF0481 protein At3g02645 [Cryptomeria japonica]